MRVLLLGVAVGLLGCVTTPSAGEAKDHDGDGVVDARDECPDVAEEPGGDGDGCPDAPQLVLEGGRIVIRGKIVFDLNSAELGGRNAPVLDALARLLTESQQLKHVEVQGHTDDTGEADFNQQLSLARAEHVKRALVQRGVAAERLTVRGLGKTQPLATNETPEGRARNRRVELLVRD